MNKYQENIFYIGNIMQYEEGQTKIYKQNIYLIYDSTSDKFISFEDTLNYSLDLLNKKLNDEEKQEILNKINKYKYSYTPIIEEGAKFIDEFSLQIVSKQNNLKK